MSILTIYSFLANSRVAEATQILAPAINYQSGFDLAPQSWKSKDLLDQQPMALRIVIQHPKNNAL